MVQIFAQHSHAGSSVSLVTRFWPSAKKLRKVFCHWRASKFAKIVQPKPKAGYQPSFAFLQKSRAPKKFLRPLTAADAIQTPLSFLTCSAVDCSLCAQTIASDSKSSETVVFAREVGASAKDFFWNFMGQFSLEHCIVLVCQDTTTFQDWTLAPCLLRTNIQDAYWHVVLRLHVFSRSHLKPVLVGSIWVTKCSTELQRVTCCCLPDYTIWMWMVPWTVPLQQCSWCSRPRMNVEGAGAALCWLQFWMFAFLSPPEHLPEPDLFPQGCGDLTRCMPDQLGKAFRQKDSNWASGIFGPCFCREPSGRRNVWRQLFPYHVPQFGVPEMHHDAAREAVDFSDVIWFFADSNANCSRSFLHRSCTRLLVRTLR